LSYNWSTFWKIVLTPTLTYWVLYFKTRHNIISRKITTLVTRHATESEADIVQSAEKFVEQVRLHIRRYDLNPYQIINTDQIAVQKEIHSSRTLSFWGEETMSTSIKSKKCFSTFLHFTIVYQYGWTSSWTYIPVFVGTCGHYQWL
jgi:hypothetical protein